MNWENQKTALQRKVAATLTWDQVDQAILHDRKTRRIELQLKTSSRRLFSLVAAFSFLHEFLTARRGLNSEEWCSESAYSNLLSGIADAICCLKKRVAFYNQKLEQMIKVSTKEGFYLIDSKVIESRKTELADPDKKIWTRLYAENVAPEKVISAYEEVKHLLPDEAMSKYKYRTGPVSHSSSSSSSSSSSKTNAHSSINAMTAFQFYQKYIRSDIAQTKSNKLSETYSESFEILPNTNIRVPRKLERYLNMEISAAKKNNLRFPSNYIRAMVYAYHIAKIFGGAFCGVQLYSMGFSLSSTATCGHYVLATSFSRLKALIRSKPPLLFWDKKKGEGTYDGEDGEDNSISGSDFFPCIMKKVSVEGKASPRKIISDAISFSPGRSEKAAISAMRTTLAEHEPDGFMAEWLSYQVSRLLGRKVSAQYALLFLVNWVAAKFRESSDESEYYEELLRKLSCIFGGTGGSVFGLTFHHKLRLVVPVVGFGSGMTNRKLREYAVHCINNVVKKLIVTSGVRRPDVNDVVEELKKMDLDRLSRQFFTNNDVMKKTNGGERAISSEKERKTLVELKGEEFVPNERRRKIHEEEYTKSLNKDLKLMFRFGVCGYRHPLPASSNKQTLVSTQLLKQRQLFFQRETAAATNWYRIIQFFFPKDTTDGPSNRQATPLADLTRKRLSCLNRYFVETVSKALKKSISCERVYDDITTKFNSDVLTLGREPGYFLRTKAGLVIQDHARWAAARAVHNYLQFFLHPGNNKSSRPPSHEMAMEMCSKFALEQAHHCVIAREHITQYERDRPFLPTEREPRFNPIPFFGVENPIYPELERRAECVVDNTATKGTDQQSSFWLKETNENFTEALVSRGVLSEVALSSNNLREIVSSKDAAYHKVYRVLRDINHKEMASDKPRKYDTMPWSSKNTGQTGRSTTEFSPNSIIVLSEDFPEGNDDEDDDDEGYAEKPTVNNDGSLFYVGGVKDIFLAGVESQRAMAQNDIMYPEKQTINGVTMINAPDISPVYRHAGKPAAISLKHTTTCIKKK